MPAEPSIGFFSAPGLKPEDPMHKIAFYEWGNPTNPKKLVCVHGLSRNGRDFDYVATELMQDYHVLSIDMPGRGKSEWLPDKTHYSYAQYLSDLILWLVRMNISRCDWLGTSMGGILGLMMATVAPDRIGKLVLNDIGNTVSATGLRRIIDYVGKIPSFPNRVAASEYVKTVFAPFGLNQEEHWQHMLSHSLRDNPDGTVSLSYDPAILESFRAETNDFRDIKDIDLKPFWQNLAVPVLILRGMESDLLSHDTAESMKRDKPNVELVEFPGVGHAPALMDLEQIRILAEWLRKPKN